MRLQLPLLVCFLCGLFMAVQYFSPHPLLATSYERLLDWSRIIAAFTLILGIGTLIRVHYARISRGSANWEYSVVALAGLAAMSLIGLFGGIEQGTPFRWIFKNVQVPMDATMFSLLAFFIASAAYRAFRVRTLEATLLLIAAMIVMFGRVPISDFLWVHIGAQSWVDKVPDLPGRVAEWIFRNPNLAAQRGILLGVGLGVISTSLKIMLGIERTYLGGGE